jgi:histidyl-tRNA synthetase
VDCVGSRSVTVEAELLAMVSEVFSRIGFQDFSIKINHRALLAALMEGAGVPEARRTPALVAIDKLDKIGDAGVREELATAGLEPETIERLMGALGVCGTPREMLAGLEGTIGQTASGKLALDELRALFKYLPLYGVPAERYKLDVATVRGLAYYTGIIFETVAEGAPVGSLASGGRYDKLIGLFSGRDLPCVGISFGIDRMFTAMELLNLFSGEERTETQVLVTLFDTETMPAAFALATELRAAGIRTEVYAEPKELGPQLAFGGKKGIPLACIQGPEEVAKGEVGLRDLRTKQQRTLPRAQVVAEALKLLAAHDGSAGGEVAVTEEC